MANAMTLMLLVAILMTPAGLLAALAVRRRAHCPAERHRQPGGAQLGYRSRPIV